MSSPSAYAPPPPHPSTYRAREEETIFEDGIVSISTSRLVLKSSNTTYSMANVTTVSVFEVHSKWANMVMLAVLCFAVGGVCVASPLSGLGFVLLLIGALFVVAAIALGLKAPTCYLRVTSVGSDINVLESKDKAYIELLVFWLNKAIVSRG